MDTIQTGESSPIEWIKTSILKLFGEHTKVYFVDEDKDGKIYSYQIVGDNISCRIEASSIFVYTLDESNNNGFCKRVFTYEQCNILFDHIAELIKQNYQ